MKTFATLLILACIGTAAQAKPALVDKDKTPRAAALDIIRLGEGHIGEALGGEVTVDVARKIATLDIDLGMKCPAGQLCAQMMPAPIRASLRIVSVKYDGCGTKIFVAKKDDRPVDGALEVLTIEDNTQNFCPHFVAMPATSLVYQTEAFDRFQSSVIKSSLSATGPEMSTLSF